MLCALLLKIEMLFEMEFCKKIACIKSKIKPKINSKTSETEIFCVEGRNHICEGVILLDSSLPILYVNFRTSNFIKQQF